MTYLVIPITSLVMLMPASQTQMIWKLITGYVFIMAGGAITWFSKKQSITTMSTTEVEYIALSKAACEARWLRNLFSELGFMQTLPTMIQGNNDGLIVMSKNPQFHKWSKHIDLQYHSIREQVQQGEITVESCRTNNQTANMLTKPLACAKHWQHTARMGLALAWRGVLGNGSMDYMPDSTPAVLYLVVTLRCTHHALRYK